MSLFVNVLNMSTICQEFVYQCRSMSEPRANMRNKSEDIKTVMRVERCSKLCFGEVVQLKKKPKDNARTHLGALNEIISLSKKSQSVKEKSKCCKI